MLRVLLSVMSGNGTFIDVLGVAISGLLFIFVVIPMHNFAQSKVAERLGDRTSKYQGMQTLNPLKHIDYIGALSILLFSIGWSKPVYINQRNFKNPKSGMALVAIFGILANLLYALLFLVVGNLLLLLFKSNTIILFIVTLLNMAAAVSVSISVFYLLPIPPLDGAKILMAILPDKYYYKYLSYERYFSLALLLIIVSGALNYPLGVVRMFVFNILNWFASLPFMLF